MQISIEDTVKAAKTPEKKPTLRKSGRKEKQQEPEDDDMEQLLYTVEPKRKARDIIPREKKMTADEEKLFTYFAKVPGLREQIVDALMMRRSVLLTRLQRQEILL